MSLQTNIPAFLPAEFVERIKDLLGDESDDFFAHYSETPDVGLRINPLKSSIQEISSGIPFHIEKIPWSPQGFRITDSVGSPGLHPYHAAGLYYIQEPAAQSVAEILNPQPGEKILDLAAAPGGKTTHIAGKLNNEGLLVANEISSKRVWDLVKNLERWGAKNTVVANETPERLAEALPGFFDRVLVDAPCSGEGMFRKMPEAVRDWSPNFVTGCAARQQTILETASRLVRPGGWLCYATCTFAPEEDEHIILQFLKDQPEYELVTPEWADGFQTGMSPLNDPEQATPVRIWPHKTIGEGHFIALLRNKFPAGSNHNTAPYKPTSSLNRLLPLWDQFVSENLIDAFTMPGHRLHLVKSYLYAVPEHLPDFYRLRIVRPGLWLGSFKKNRFEPAHAFAMSLNKHDVKRVLNLTPEQAQQYLRREAIQSAGEDGWVLALIDNRYPIGWGKRVRGLVKNHYPKGLRIL